MDRSLILIYGTARSLRQNAILNPMRVPPLHGIHHPTVDEHREIQVIPTGQAGDARLLPNRLILLHRGPDRHADEQVAVRDCTPYLIDNDTVAVDTEFVGEQDNASIGGHDRGIGVQRKVEAEVHLPVHFRPSIGVRFADRQTRIRRRCS